MSEEKTTISEFLEKPSQCNVVKVNTEESNEMENCTYNSHSLDPLKHSTPQLFELNKIDSPLNHRPALVIDVSGVDCQNIAILKSAKKREESRKIVSKISSLLDSVEKLKNSSKINLTENNSVLSDNEMFTLGSEVDDGDIFKTSLIDETSSLYDLDSMSAVLEISPSSSWYNTPFVANEYDASSEKSFDLTSHDNIPQATKKINSSLSPTSMYTRSNSLPVNKISPISRKSTFSRTPSITSTISNKSLSPMSRQLSLNNSNKPLSPMTRQNSISSTISIKTMSTMSRQSSITNNSISPISRQGSLSHKSMAKMETIFPRSTSKSLPTRQRSNSTSSDASELASIASEPNVRFKMMEYFISLVSKTYQKYQLPDSSQDSWENSTIASTAMGETIVSENL